MNFYRFWLHNTVKKSWLCRRTMEIQSNCHGKDSCNDTFCSYYESFVTFKRSCALCFFWQIVIENAKQSCHWDFFSDFVDDNCIIWLHAIFHLTKKIFFSNYSGEDCFVSILNWFQFLAFCCYCWFFATGNERLKDRSVSCNFRFWMVATMAGKMASDYRSTTSYTYNFRCKTYVLANFYVMFKRFFF